MRRTALKRRTALARTKVLKRRRARRRKEDEPARQVFRDAAREQGFCQVSGSRGAWQAHHVVEAQELRRRGVEVYDPRNALRVSPRVHERHTTATKRIPLRCLTDENIEYAFELMGSAAFVYLTRLYEGHDPRVELALAEIEHGDE